MTITADDVRRVADLARIALDDEQVTRVARELGDVLDHVAVLSAVPTDGVTATAGVGAGGMPLREDGGHCRPLAYPRESFAPAMRDGFFLVPRLASHGEWIAIRRTGRE